MVEVVTLEGPLEPARLRWIADLYGNADPKLRRDDVLEHLFLRSPAGAGLHAFALDGARPIGHFAVVPLQTRLGGDGLRSGKVEALWVEPDHRGRQPGGELVVGAMLERLYAYADECGFELLHGLLTPRIGSILRLRPLGNVGEPSLVAAVSSDALAGRTAGRALAGAQHALRGLAGVAARSARDATVREATGEDADLASAAMPPAGRWTVLADDAWDWYRSSPLVRVLQVPGRSGSRALVQLPGVPGQALRVIGWRPARPGFRPAFALLSAAGRLAHETGAGTVRFQPWPSPAGGGALQRACRLLGFVPRNDLTSLWVRASDPALERIEAVVPTPLLYLAF